VKVLCFEWVGLVLCCFVLCVCVCVCVCVCFGCGVWELVCFGSFFVWEHRDGLHLQGLGFQ
jgi:hypothetical protein